MKTHDWVETSVLLDNDIYPMISASGVFLSIVIAELAVRVLATQMIGVRGVHRVCCRHEAHRHMVWLHYSIIILSEAKGILHDDFSLIIGVFFVISNGAVGRIVPEALRLCHLDLLLCSHSHLFHYEVDLYAVEHACKMQAIARCMRIQINDNCT